MWLTRETSADGERLEELLPRLDGLARFVADLQARLASAGVEGVGGVLALHRSLEAALADVRGDELARARGQMAILERRLAELAAGLTALHRLKSALDGGRRGTRS